MADAIPPTPAAAPPSSAGGGGVVPVRVVSPIGGAEGAAALRLAEGALVEATVSSRAKGAIEITLPSGTLHLKAMPGATLPPFAAGTRLTLHMAGGPEGGQLFLVGVNGRLLAGASALPGFNLAAFNALFPGPGGFVPGGGILGQPAVSPGQAGMGGAIGGQGGPIGVPGMVVATGGGAVMPLGLSATLIRPALPPGGAPGPGTASQPGALPQQPGLGAPFAGLPADLPAGTVLTVRIATVQPGTNFAAPAPGGNGTMPSGVPGLPQATGPLSPDPTIVRLPATVAAHPPGGNALMETPIGTLSIAAQTNLTEGARVMLEVVGKPVLPPVAASAPPRAEGLSSLGWPALSQAIEVLTTANQPQALEQLLRAIPQADGRLAATMVAFTGALRSGDNKAALPEASLRGIEKAGRKDIAARLRSDLEALGEEAGRPVGNGDWRAYTLPFLHGGAIEPVRLFVRRVDEDEAGARPGAKGKDHRFVVDLNLSNLGRLQLDGLIRREDKLFDLIIRTDAPLSAEMRRDILGIFTNASEVVGTKGSVSFQAGGRWIEFPPAPPAPTRIDV